MRCRVGPLSACCGTAWRSLCSHEGRPYRKALPYRAFNETSTVACCSDTTVDRSTEAPPQPPASARRADPRVLGLIPQLHPGECGRGVGGVRCGLPPPPCGELWDRRERWSAPDPPSPPRICTWWCAVCCALSRVHGAGLRCETGSRTPRTAHRAPRKWAEYPAGPSGSCTPPRRLPAPPLPLNPAGRPPSSSAGCGCPAPAVPWRGHRPARAVRRPATPRTSSARIAAGARIRAAPCRPRRRPRP